MKTELRCGVYEHYKGKKYLVLGSARHSETGEEFVVYVTLYEHDGAAMWVRPVEMFTQEVEVGGERRPRFRYVGDGDDS
ncbi:MAG TPA: DUF1653 domain-containing protein [Pyrinomonadaceae bacterium]|nr:DUF1653 domain-containing protein [Pyrinomonadaceae bacterium]